MKIRCFLLLLTLALPVVGQPEAEQINTRNACSYSGGGTPPIVMTFASDTEAETAVKEIVEASGLTQNFVIRASGVENAAAAMDGPRRFLLYNQAFFHKMRQATGTRWAAMSVMAHEIGHHLNSHTLEPKREPKYEIEADYFSGFILQQLGASLSDAHAALNYLPTSDGSATHPPKHDRLAAVANGWTKACHKDPSCNRAEPEATKPNPVVEPKPPKSKPGPDSCEFARDDSCDEPDLCDPGTDTTDCKRPKTPGPNSCEYAHDGSCDEPSLCRRGTDTADCRAAANGPLFCCDAWGNRWCQIVANPGPVGSPCFCAGVPGSGLMCR